MNPMNRRPRILGSNKIRCLARYISKSFHHFVFHNTDHYKTNICILSVSQYPLNRKYKQLSVSVKLSFILNENFDINLDFN